MGLERASLEFVNKKFSFFFCFVAEDPNSKLKATLPNPSHSPVLQTLVVLNQKKDHFLFFHCVGFESVLLPLSFFDFNEKLEALIT